MRGLHGWVIGLISMVVRGGRGSIVEVWTARGIFGIEMGLGAVKTAVDGLGGLGVPLGIIVVVLVVMDGCGWVVWNDPVLRRLAKVRIVVPWVGHNVREGL